MALRGPETRQVVATVLCDGNDGQSIVDKRDVDAAAY